MFTHRSTRRANATTGRVPASYPTPVGPNMNTRAGQAATPTSAAMLLPENVLSLQRSIGNRAIVRMLKEQTVAKQPAGQAMPDNIQRAMENSLGADFSDVTVHPSSPLATTLGVSAFAQGNEIHFGRGEFQPHTHTGRNVLGHELAHVMQNKEKRVHATTVQAKGFPIQVNDDRNLEREADIMGERAATGQVGAENLPSPRTPQRTTNSKALTTHPLQFLIHKGKTHRSKVYERLALSAWYLGLANDNERAFARLLHENKDEHYTESEAEDAIQERIARGDPVPTFDVDEKAERLKRVREYVNTNAPSEDDNSYKQGMFLSKASARAYNRQRKKHLRTDRHANAVKKINKTKPGLFKDQEKILSDRSPWEQVVALMESKPKSFNYDMGGVEVKLDALDVKSNEERGKKRKVDEINKAQTFIEQEGRDNSYWAMSDNSRKRRKIDPAHRQLRSLEAERDPQATFTTFMKDALYDLKEITNEQAFGDETPYAFQEYKGALNPTSAMKRMQIASSYQVLQLAQNVKAVLGTQVGKRKQTKGKYINKALQLFVDKKTEPNYRALVKEIYRLIRAQTGANYSSDTESDSDSEY